MPVITEVQAHQKRIRRKSRLKTIYGLTLEQYNEMFKKQHGRCAICKKPESSLLSGRLRALAVDHDHKTGKIRSLLCASCNRGLGYFLDNKDNLLKAFLYLREHSVAC